MRIGVVQHMIRTHERMDLAALLSEAERASEEGVRLLAYPPIPGLEQGTRLVEAFAQNVAERVPGVSFIAPDAAERALTRGPVATVLGRTLVLSGDECIDPDTFGEVEEMQLDALVWQMLTFSPQQAEAIIELALDASLSLAGLVLVAAVCGEARGVRSYGGSVIAAQGEMLAEAGDRDGLLLADVEVPVSLPARRGPRPVPAPVLIQRLESRGD